jgi:hypothetical protein
MKRIFVTLVLGASLAALAYAGAIRDFRCADEKCGFKAEVLSGEGKIAIQVAGYCVECGRMRTASFLRADLKTRRPEPSARVWDSVTGRTLDLYPCPECKKPFAAVTRMDYCPKCGQKTISETDDGKWD